MGQQPIEHQPHGTPSLRSPKAIPVFLGTKWGEHSSLAKGVENALHPIMQGIFMKSLSNHYSVGAEIGYGSVAPTISLHQQSDGTGFSSLNDTQLANTINTLANNRGSAKSPGDIYVIYPEPGSHLQLQSLQGGWAYHDITNNGNAFCVIPYPSASATINGDNQVFPTKLNFMTSATSHEICEAVINPNPQFPNWITQGGLEAADQCTSLAKSSIVSSLLQEFPNGTTLQQIWNPTTNSCEIVPGAKEPFRLVPDFIGVMFGSVIAAGIGACLNKKYPGNPLNKFILKPLGLGAAARHRPPDIEAAPGTPPAPEHELAVIHHTLPGAENRNNGITAVVDGSGAYLDDRGLPEQDVLVTSSMSSRQHRVENATVQLPASQAAERQPEATHTAEAAPSGPPEQKESLQLELRALPPIYGQRKLPTTQQRGLLQKARGSEGLTRPPVAHITRD